MNRVGDLAVEIGRRLGVSIDQLEILRIAGRLHDMGKIGVPNQILRKPGRLTPAEFETMKLHSPRGDLIARRSRLLTSAAATIRWHHERMDGTGYPDGLRGEDIPIEARIVAVADVWDALTCDRPYRGAMAMEDAIAVVRESAGRHLDPACVDVLFTVLGLDARASEQSVA